MNEAINLAQNRVFMPLFWPWTVAYFIKVLLKHTTLGNWARDSRNNVRIQTWSIVKISVNTDDIDKSLLTWFQDLATYKQVQFVAAVCSAGMFSDFLNFILLL